MSYELGLIGAGNMAEAIARAVIDKGVVPPQGIVASDVSEARLDVFRAMGVATTQDNAAVVSRSAQVMLAVKPQQFASVASSLAGYDGVVISIMAGLGTAKIEAAAGRSLRLVRVMPNTPLMVGLGMSGIAVGTHARPGDEALALRLFGAAGEAIVVDEPLIDAVTAVSGSGPAYLFYLAEAMQRAAVDLGLGDHARLLVQQTLAGAAALLTQSPDTAEVLRRKVTSPGGTTEAAIRHLESHGVGTAIAQALTAARDRSIELGKG